MPFSADSTIRDLLADERAKAIVEKYLPGITAHPDLPMALYMSLREVSYYPEATAAGLTREKVDAIDAELRMLD